MVTQAFLSPCPLFVSENMKLVLGLLDERMIFRTVLEQIRVQPPQKLTAKRKVTAARKRLTNT